MGGRPSGHRFPEASWPRAVRVPERLTERCCSFGVRDWLSRSSPARGRYPAILTDLAVAALPSGGQLVLRRGDGLAAVGPLAREVGDRAGQFPHGPAHCDTEYALAALQQVDDLFGRGALVDRCAVGEQRDVG